MDHFHFALSALIAPALRISACRLVLSASALCVLAILPGCALLPKSAPQPTFYSLDSLRTTQRSVVAPAETAPTLVVSPTTAAPGFDSQRIIYTRETHQLEYFAHSEWVDTPARMLTPLVIAALENSNAFRAVIHTPSAAAGDMRLDTEILRLQQDFRGGPSKVRLTLRAYLVDNRSRRVLAWREFDESVAAGSDDPHGGIVAANRAVQNVLQTLAAMCNETAAGWKAP